MIFWGSLWRVEDVTYPDGSSPVVPDDMQFRLRLYYRNVFRERLIRDIAGAQQEKMYEKDKRH
jgi:hypothetical protein